MFRAGLLKYGIRLGQSTREDDQRRARQNHCIQLNAKEELAGIFVKNKEVIVNR
jgi:hypothetical protein